MKRISVFVVLTLFVGLNAVTAQAQKFSTYYLQRASLFERLPHSADDIIFLGDSITDGGEWCELFGDARLKNRGISGDVTWGVLNRLTEVTAGKPAKIFLMIGVNDLARGKTVEEIVANQQKIVERIRRETPETQLYIQSVLPVNPVFGTFKNHTDKTEQILAVNEQLKTISENTPKTTFIDLFRPFSTPDHLFNTDYTNDGLHLTGDGYVLWKSLIRHYVQ